MYFNQAYEQAQPDFRSVYDEAPGTELGQEALFWSADANYQIGRYDRAAVEFSQFVNNYPDHEMVGAAKYSLGWTFFLMGDFENEIGRASCRERVWMSVVAVAFGQHRE